VKKGGIFAAMRWAGQMVFIGEYIDLYKILLGTANARDHLQGSGRCPRVIVKCFFRRARQEFGLDKLVS
jgi:hypothetical protein